MSDKSRKAVPREPDQAMVDAGWAAYYKHATPGMMSPIWRAMYDAAPVLATAPAEPLTDDETNLVCALGAVHGHEWALEHYREPAYKEAYMAGWLAKANAAPPTAPAEPPKDGEVAAMIEALNNLWGMRKPFNDGRACPQMVGLETWRIVAQGRDLDCLLAAADALARLSTSQFTPETVREFAKCRADLCAAKTELARLSAPVPVTTTIAELQRTVIDYVRSKDPQRLDDWYLPSTHSDPPAPVPAREQELEVALKELLHYINGPMAITNPDVKRIVLTALREPGYPPPAADK